MIYSLSRVQSDCERRAQCMSEEIGDSAEWYRVSLHLKTQNQKKNRNSLENHQIAIQFEGAFSLCSLCLLVSVYHSMIRKNGWFKHRLSGNDSDFSPGDYVIVSLIVSFHFPPGAPSTHPLFGNKRSKIRAVWSFRKNVRPQLAYVQLSKADSCRILNSLEKYLTEWKTECRAALANSIHAWYSKALSPNN